MKKSLIIILVLLAIYGIGMSGGCYVAGDKRTSDGQDIRAQVRQEVREELDEQVEKRVKEEMDKFIKDYEKANPKK